MNIFFQNKNHIEHISSERLSVIINHAWSKSDVDESIKKFAIFEVIRYGYDWLLSFGFDSEELLNNIKKRIDEEIIPLYLKQKEKKNSLKLKGKQYSRDGTYRDTNQTKHMKQLKRSIEIEDNTRSRESSDSDDENKKDYSSEQVDKQTNNHNTRSKQQGITRRRSSRLQK